jgi:hypothetical protein
MNRQARPARSDLPASEPQQPEPARLPPPSVTRDEVDLLIRRAGLTLNAGQKADLAVALQHLVTLAAKLPRARPFADEPAFVFHPPAQEPTPPARPAPTGKAATKAAKPAAKAAAKPAAKPAKPARTAAKAKPKARAKAARAAAKPGRRK